MVLRRSSRHRWRLCFRATSQHPARMLTLSAPSTAEGRERSESKSHQQPQSPPRRLGRRIASTHEEKICVEIRACVPGAHPNLMRAILPLHLSEPPPRPYPLSQNDRRFKACCPVGTTQSNACHFHPLISPTRLPGPPRPSQGPSEPLRPECPPDAVPGLDRRDA